MQSNYLPLIIVEADRIRMQNNVIVFLQAVKLIGCHNGVIVIFHNDMDLPEIGIPLVDIVYTDEGFLFTKRILVGGIRTFNDFSIPQHRVVNVVLLVCLTVRNSRDKSGALAVAAASGIDTEQDAKLSVCPFKYILFGNKEKLLWKIK